MTLTADDKRRVTLPTKPGERFDLQQFDGDRFILTRLVPVRRLAPKTIRRGGLTMLTGAGKLTQKQVAAALEEFP